MCKPGSFSPREKGVVRLAALGYTNRQIGKELNLQENTIKVYIQRCDLPRRSLLPAYGIKHGFITVEQYLAMLPDKPMVLPQ